MPHTKDPPIPASWKEILLMLSALMFFQDGSLKLRAEGQLNSVYLPNGVIWDLQVFWGFLSMQSTGIAKCY